MMFLFALACDDHERSTPTRAEFNEQFIPARCRKNCSDRYLNDCADGECEDFMSGVFNEAGQFLACQYYPNMAEQCLAGLGVCETAASFCYGAYACDDHDIDSGWFLVSAGVREEPPLDHDRDGEFCWVDETE